MPCVPGDGAFFFTSAGYCLFALSMWLIGARGSGPSGIFFLQVAAECESGRAARWSARLSVRQNTLSPWGLYAIFFASLIQAGLPWKSPCLKFLLSER